MEGIQSTCGGGVGVVVMSIKQTILITMLAVGGIGALLTFLPGSPVWKLFNPNLTVARPNADPPSQNPAAPPTQSLTIVTLLPKDAIPAIQEAQVRFVTGEEANGQMQPTDRVIGLSINGDHRAYSTAQLSSREVVNDTVGGIPVAVTW